MTPVDTDIPSRVELTFNWYQGETADTAVYVGMAAATANRLGAPEHKLELSTLLRRLYVSLGVADEAGECLGKVKKLLRDSDGTVTPEFREALAHEIGDALWYLTRLCSEFGLSLVTVAMMNVMKLRGRALRGTIGGSGDVR